MLSQTSPALRRGLSRPDAPARDARTPDGHRDRQAFYDGLALRRRRAQIAARRALEAASEHRLPVR